MLSLPLECDDSCSSLQAGQSPSSAKFFESESSALYLPSDEWLGSRLLLQFCKFFCATNGHI